MGDRDTATCKDVLCLMPACTRKGGKRPTGLSCLLICSLNQSRTNCCVGVGNLRLSLLVLFLIISTLQLTLKDFILQIAQLNGFFFFFL